MSTTQERAARRWRRIALPCVATLALSLLPCGDALADIYRYVDENGVVTFTNVPTATKRGKKRHRVRLKRDASGRAVITNRGAVPKGARVKPRDPARAVQRYMTAIEKASRRHNVPVALIKAVIRAESGFDPKAVSRAGAQGLMQLMPQTAADMGVVDAFDPEENIMGGTRYLRFLANKYKGDMVLTLAAYNGGPSNVDKYGYIPPFVETQKYVGRVLKYYYQYKDAALALVEPQPAAPAGALGD